MTPLVSVIVPVYKVEQYLRKCIDSIINQTYGNLEIILVDDGSPDNCGAICDEYAQKDPRIKVIHKQNAGIGEARNSGIEISTGEYLMFVDSDDHLSYDAVQVLLERIISDGSDLAVGKHVDEYEDGTLNGTFCTWMKNAVTDKTELFERLATTQYISVVAWAKLYRRSLFAEVRFPNYKCGEDLYVFPLVVSQCEKISIVDTTVSYYLQRSTSILHQLTDEKIHDDLEAVLRLVRFLIDHGYPQSAQRWYAIGLSKAMPLTNKRVIRKMINCYFSPKEKRFLLSNAKLKTKAKYLTLYIPAIYKLAKILE